MDLQKPVVLITGSEGRLGQAIAAQLSGAYEIVGFERNCKGAGCIQADLGSAASLAQGCSILRERYGSRLAAVIHLAAFYAFSSEPDPLYQSVNVDGTARLLQALQAFEVEQFIYASTMLVHAPTAPGQPIDEDAPLAPAWPYPQSKRDAELAVEAGRGAIPALVLRIAGVYTDMGELPSLAYQIARIHERQMASRVFPGETAHGQALVHLDDVALAFRAAVDRRAQLPPAATLLIGEPVTESYQALQHLIGRLLHGETWATRQIPAGIAATGAWLQGKMEQVVPDAIDGGVKPFIQPFMVPLADDHYELDIARAGQLLGWRPTRTLRATLPAIAGALRQDPAGWYRRNKIPVPPWLQAAPGEPGTTAMMDAFNTRARTEHQGTLWCHFANIALGLWLVTSPFILGLAQNWGQAGPLSSPNGRGLPYSDTWMTASDIGSGALLVLFGLLSLARDAGWARWCAAATGLWLLFAPLVFWTGSAAAYANDTLVGALAIAFAVAIPSAPGISPAARTSGPDAPPGWDYSPSCWTNRIPIIALAFVGLFISRYLAAYQLGHIDAAWDPWFGDGSERIVTSSVSEAWPVADAGLGAAVYIIEIVTGIIGDKRRWRTMPWLVLLFGILIVPLGGVSVFFIIIQPIVIGTWCTLCLVGALAMLLQIPYSLDEILATLQFLKQRRRQGQPLGYLLLHGDTMEGGSADNTDNFAAPARVVMREMLLSGISVPWTLMLCTALGIALMCTRLLFDTSGLAAHNDHVVGALVVTCSIMAWGDVARPLRFINVGFGAWLLVAPSLFDGYTRLGGGAAVIAGLALIALAFPMGRIATHMGAWDRIARFELRLARGARQAVPGDLT
jgi:nucleoside-diphosphate-sugar epimerase